MDNLDEALIYLHAQIDPHDRLNPKYALLWKRIEAIQKARCDLMSAQLTTCFTVDAAVLTHPVDILKDLGVYMTPEHEAAARAVCDAPVGGDPEQ